MRRITRQVVEGACRYHANQTGSNLNAGPSGLAQAFPVTRDQAGWRKRFR
jgi:hypothetical protein